MEETKVHEDRINQVETRMDGLEHAMTQLADNVNTGFTNINTRIAEGNRETLKEVGKLYGEINERAIESAKKDNVNWSLVVSALAVLLVGAGFFYTTINDRIDYALEAERELRTSETHRSILEAEKLRLRDTLQLKEKNN